MAWLNWTCEVESDFGMLLKATARCKNLYWATYFLWYDNITSDSAGFPREFIPFILHLYYTFVHSQLGYWSVKSADQIKSDIHYLKIFHLGVRVTDNIQSLFFVPQASTAQSMKESSLQMKAGTSRWLWRPWEVCTGARTLYLLLIVLLNLLNFLCPARLVGFHSQEDLHEFLREAEIMQNFDHENVVKLLGKMCHHSLSSVTVITCFGLYCMLLACLALQWVGIFRGRFILLAFSIQTLCVFWPCSSKEVWTWNWTQLTLSYQVAGRPHRLATHSNEVKVAESCAEAVQWEWQDC